MPTGLPGTIMNVRELLQSGLRQLPASSRLDCEILLCSVLNQERHYLYAYADTPVKDQHIADFNLLIARRAAGFPVAYLLGQKEFWSLSLEVNQDTLIPRPETELLVELALGVIPADKKSSLLDLGTGSGAIALAIASERPQCRITATDISLPALAVARRNAAKLGLDNIRFVHADWFAAIESHHYDLIVSNPPYVESGYNGFIVDEIRHEPRIALDGGSLGLNPYQRIIPAAVNFLASSGRIMFEHGHQQAGAIRQLLQLNHYRNVSTRQDAAGLDRITAAELP